jgi:hypothetical protein
MEMRDPHPVGEYDSRHWGQIKTTQVGGNPVRHPAKAIEGLHANLTVGMFSIPNLLYFQNEKVLANISHSSLDWSYNARPLFFPYLAFTLVGVVGVGFGLSVILDNKGLDLSRDASWRPWWSIDIHSSVISWVAIWGEAKTFIQDRIEGSRVRFEQDAAGFVIES